MTAVIPMEPSHFPGAVAPENRLRNLCRNISDLSLRTPEGRALICCRAFKIAYLCVHLGTPPVVEPEASLRLAAELSGCDVCSELGLVMALTTLERMFRNSVHPVNFRTACYVCAMELQRLIRPGLVIRRRELDGE